MDRGNGNLKESRPTSVASEWAKTFVLQSLFGVLLAVAWTVLGLQ